VQAAYCQPRMFGLTSGTLPRPAQLQDAVSQSALVCRVLTELWWHWSLTVATGWHQRPL